jgi:hypothetical protein
MSAAELPTEPASSIALWLWMVGLISLVAEIRLLLPCKRKLFGGERITFLGLQ